MESVNDIQRERVNFLPCHLFRSMVLALRFLPMRRTLLALAIALVVVVGSAVVVDADLENSVFTSKTEHLRLVVPRGWRATDQPSYPGLLLWMMRNQPEGRMVLTSGALPREFYCSWPVTCGTSHDFTSMQARVACALRD